MHVLETLLDLRRPELADVRAELADPQAAAQALLAYFRKRTQVRFPLDRTERESMRGRCATEEDLTTAENATRNILIAAPVYPPHDFGATIDWFADHEDYEWQVQLHRMYSWAPLGKAYWHTGDERYAETYTRQLADWLDHCMSDDEAVRRVAWRRLEAGIRGHIWMHHFHYFIDSPAFTPELLVRFLRASHKHAEYLAEGISHRNWGLMEAEGLAFIAMTFPEFKDAAAWEDAATTHLNEQIGEQIRSDGHQTEQCLNYHQGCIAWFARSAELAKLNGKGDRFTPAFWEGIERMCGVLLQLSFPDGTTPQFGDNHSTTTVRKTLAQWAPLFGREDFRFVGSGGAEGTAPQKTAFALRESGFYSLRSGWNTDATMLVLNCGPHGGWHDQEHNGTFEIFAGGRRLTPDSGCYTYITGPERSWHDQTRVHQCMTLDRANASQETARLLAWQPGDTLDRVTVENESYPGLRHRRTVLFLEKQFVVLVDEALGEAAGDVSFHFQFAPTQATLEPGHLRARTEFADGTNLLLQSFASDAWTLEEEEGWVSYKYGKREPRPAFRIHREKTAGDAGLRLITVLAPYAGDAPTVSANLPASPAGSNTVEFAVTIDGNEHAIQYALE